VEGVTLDVAAGDEEMPVILDRERLETTLVDVAGARGMALGVPPLRMGQGQPAHESGKLPVGLGLVDQGEVVGHQAVGEELDGMPSDSLVEDAKEGPVVVEAVEDREVGVSAVERVIDQPSLGSPRWSSRART
jgi:hypothetical protein